MATRWMPAPGYLTDRAMAQLFDQQVDSLGTDSLKRHHHPRRGDASLATGQGCERPVESGAFQCLGDRQRTGTYR
jgi:hypothetical protein